MGDEPSTRSSDVPDGTSSHGKGAAFVWPPAPVDHESAPSAHALNTNSLNEEKTLTRPPPWRRLLIDAESFWLAPVSMPLARRIESTSWRPDSLDRYCNRCAQTVGFGEDDEFGCARCRDRRFVWSRAVRLGAFEGDLASWVKEVKFARNASLANDLGRLLASRLVESGLPKRRVCVVPIPMSRRERLTKGFDHARRIGEGVAAGLSIGRGEERVPLVRALVREHRPSQRSMTSVIAREQNVRRAFRLAKGVDLSGWTVVLVDDVITTGATMRAASKALWPRQRTHRPAAIWAAAIGVTPDHASDRSPEGQPQPVSSA